MTISATDLALRAFEARPSRAEALADLSRYFRDRGMNETAAMLARRGLAVPPSDDFLFVETWALETLAEDLAVAGYYSSDPDIRAAAREVCDRMSFDRALGEEARILARHNLHFYLQPIKDVFPSWSARRLTFSPPDGYHQMAPSVTRHGGRILAAQRCINYAIDAGGYYTAKGRISIEAPVHTRTLLIEFDPETLEECVRGEITIPGLTPHPGAAVLGFEDSRLISWEGELWTISTVLDQNPHGHAEQWLARLAPDLTMVDARPIRVERQQPREKNWVPFVEGPRLRFVYSTDPTRVIDTDGKTIVEHTPDAAAEHIRGGSQAIPFDDGWLAVVHWVEWFDGWPKYRHRFVHYDRDLRLRSMSPGWVFATERPEPALLEGYEYATGLCWHPDAKRLAVGYQVHEREAWIGTVTAADVRAALRRPVAVVNAPVATTTPPPANVAHAVPPRPVEAIRAEDVDWAVGQTNRTLRDAAAIDRATRALTTRGLLEHRGREKNWDTWIALVHAQGLDPSDRVLDAGGDRNSAFLPALARRGFTQLISLNLEERHPGVEGGVIYMCGDITDSRRWPPSLRLSDGSFKFISCLSVLEHGVDWRKFFAEAARLLAPAGRLFVSVDFWETPVSTAHVVFTGSYAGQRWEIFTPNEVTEMIAHAETLGLNVVGDVDLKCHNRVTTHLGCSYTFLNLLFEASRNRPMAEGFPYVLRDRSLGAHRFDFWITDATAAAWYGRERQDEPDKLWCLERVEPGMTVIDCGAHHGQMTVAFSKAVGPSGRVLAFEALLGNADVIERNLTLNGCANVKVHPHALGDGGIGRFAENGGNAVRDGGGSTLEIITVKLDDALAGVAPDFVKIDVEGQELAVLRGARRFISLYRPILDVELHNSIVTDRRANLEEILALLEPLDYRHSYSCGQEEVLLRDNVHLYCEPNA